MVCTSHLPKHHPPTLAKFEKIDWCPSNIMDNGLSYSCQIASESYNEKKFKKDDQTGYLIYDIENYEDKVSCHLDLFNIPIVLKKEIV